jgi:5-methyltetrahydrofolate--homocysteine methyltransferase
MTTNQQLDQLADAVAGLDHKNIGVKTQAALDAGIAPTAILNGLARGMETIGVQFKTGEVFLPEVMVACDVYKAGFELILPRLRAQQDQAFLGTLIIGSIYGDVHTVGKDIAAAVFAAAGFKVVDLGVTVKDEAWLAAVREHNPDIVGLGAYMTSTFMHTREVVRQLSVAGLRDRLKVICGGPSVNDQAAKSFGADGASNNAWEAVEIMRVWMQSKTSVPT